MPTPDIHALKRLTFADSERAIMRLRLQQCLKILGVSLDMIPDHSWEGRTYRRSCPLWEADSILMQELLRAAHSAYRTSIRAAHPDLGGDHLEAAIMNRVWEKTEALFAKHGFRL